MGTTSNHGVGMHAVSERMQRRNEAPVVEIVTREDFSDTTFLIEFRHPMMAKAARPGQFVIVIPNEHAERIPLTIADFDREKGTVTLVIQAVGKTTKADAAGLPRRHGSFWRCRPHGRTQPHQSDIGKVVCVGGGLGVAPVFPQARAFKEHGAYVIGVIGFRNKELVFWEDKFREILRRIHYLQR